MKYWKVFYEWPCHNYGNGFSYKWARTSKDAIKLVLKSSRGTINILGVEESN